MIGAHGSHGTDAAAGVELADGRWCGDGADLSPVDLLLLVSCAVGKLTQQGHLDVEGLYAQFVNHRGRCVVAARWIIADLEAAEFAAEFAREYLAVLKSLPEGQPIPPFTRARAMNRARRKLLANDTITQHLAAAFEMYGLG